jgi:hypothetical protein
MKLVRARPDSPVAEDVDMAAAADTAVAKVASEEATEPQVSAVASAVSADFCLNTQLQR